MIETNFLSVVALTKEVVKGMIRRNRGHIVNMSSIAGKEAYHGAHTMWSADRPRRS
jgi:NADP-dependent 3-hydroxy acid dehydrogenase YdfG